MRRSKKGQKLHAYTPEEVQFLIAHHELPRQTLTARFNETFSTKISCGGIKQKCRKLGYPSQETGHFPKGQIPWNKGKKGYMGANRTSFKKGQISHNAKQVGELKIDESGLVYVKVCEGARSKAWRPRSHLVWQQHNGNQPIPPHHVIFHLNGMADDDRIENLALIHRNQLAQLAKLKYKTVPDPLKSAAFLLAQLRKEASEVKRALNDTKTTQKTTHKTT